MTRSTDLDLICKEVSQGEDYAVFSYDGMTYAVLFHPYQPQIEGDLMVDNYYPAYQEVRDKRLALTARTEALEPKLPTYPYKGIAILSGKVKRLTNSLTAHPTYGSFFVMEILSYPGEMAPHSPMEEMLTQAGVDIHAWLTPSHLGHSQAILLSEPYVTYQGCHTCLRCAKACPMGAIEEHAFDAQKCLRTWQGKGELPPEIAKANGKRILGCHTCQIVCPLNCAIPVAKPLIDGQALWQGVKEGSKGLMPFESLLGRNYLRPVKLAALCLNALANSRDDSAKETAKGWLTHPDGRLREAAKRYLAAVAEAPFFEREVKRMVDPAFYDRYCGKGETVKQINYYFASGEHRLRLREKDGRWEMTLKVRAGEDREDGHYEYNAPIDEADALDYLAKGLPRDVVLALLGQDIGGDATYLGSLTTYRTTFVEEGLTIELDKSEYLGVTDYEIECEVQDEEEWQHAKAWADAHTGSSEQSTGKFKRFTSRLASKK